MRPIEAQTKSWKGKTLARPEATMATRAAIAPMIPITAQNIHAGKNAPNSEYDGAPLTIDPSMASAGVPAETNKAIEPAGLARRQTYLQRNGFRLALGSTMALLRAPCATRAADSTLTLSLISPGPPAKYDEWLRSFERMGILTCRLPSALPGLALVSMLGRVRSKHEQGGQELELVR